MKIDPKEFRSALGAFATGVTIVTTLDADGTDKGLTVNSFSSVSLDPPMVLWSLSKTSANLDAFAKAGHWAVHVLGTDQEELCMRFASRSGDRFDGIAIQRSNTGVPLLVGCSARFECRKAFQYDGGDHIIFVGEVVEFEHQHRPPLVFHRGTFSTTAPFPTSALDVLSSDLAYLLVRAFFLIRAPVSQQAAALGLTLDQVHVLALLMRKDRERRYIDECLKDFGVRSGDELIDDLIDRELVGAQTEETSLLRLSEDGQSTLIALMAAGQAREADLVADLTSAEVQVMKVLLSRLSGLPAESDGRLLAELWAPAGA